KVVSPNKPGRADRIVVQRFRLKRSIPALNHAIAMTMFRKLVVKPEPLEFDDLALGRYRALLILRRKLVAPCFGLELVEHRSWLPLFVQQIARPPSVKPARTDLDSLLHVGDRGQDQLVPRAGLQYVSD